MMTDFGTSAFLRQAYENNWRRYQQSLQAGARGWDVCILTASGERQAAVYRNLLLARSEAGLLPSRTRFVVLADPDGQRIGSGGATLRALALWSELQADQGESIPDVAGARVLIIHSGGDSKRLPHCSATGKLLARVPRELPDGRGSTVLDEFLIGLTGLAFNVPPGMLVVSGDVLLVFDHLQLSFPQQGAVGVAAAAPVDMARRHGVYVSGEHSRAVRAYLHKPGAAELAEWQAIGVDGTVQIDTGLLWFDATCVQRLRELTEHAQVARLCGLTPAAEARPGGVHLYADLLYPLARSTTFERYLADASDGPANADIQAARRVIWQALRETPLSVERLQPAFFAHLGTSLEYWRLITADADAARTCGWTKQAAAWQTGGEREDAGGDCPAAYVINGVTAGCAPAAQEAERMPALIVDSCLGAPLAWQGASLIASVQTEEALTLTSDVVVHQLPIAGGGYVTQIYGMRDDPKRAWDEPAATYVNRPWRQWLRDAGVAAEAVWPAMQPAERTLWNARLFPLAGSREESLELSLPLQNARLATAAWRARWQNATRLSLAKAAAQADVPRILDELADIEDIVAARRFAAAVFAEQPACQARAHVTRLGSRLARRLSHAERQFAASDVVTQMRCYAALAVASDDRAWEDKAFAILSHLIQAQTPGLGAAGRAHAAERIPAVRVEACARVDFGGGWTDTPPYSIEQGGTVLNGAIALHGAFPIVVEAERLDEPRLILHGRDIDTSAQPLAAGDVLGYTDLSDPFALLKAALVLRGIVPADTQPDTPLASVLREAGGLRVSTQTSIPRGSGLGTSSIVAGAVLACLARFQGCTLSEQELFDEVLCLEQMLTTGGGWQDQVGGLVGGIKLVSSEPGLPQKLTVAPVALSPERRAEMAQRFLLVYTGQQRLAKDLLRNVMGRWMERDPEMTAILRRIAELAHEMRRALLGGDLGEFGRLLGEHWLLNKRMDPGCTNTFIDGLFAFMQPYIDGGKLAGAGGGGFAAVIARDATAARDLAAALRRYYPGTPVAVWPSAIPDEGLRIHVGP